MDRHFHFVLHAPNTNLTSDLINQIYCPFTSIAPLGVLKGKLPPRALSLVMEWAQIHQDELMEDWTYAANHKKLQKIPPLE